MNNEKIGTVKINGAVAGDTDLAVALPMRSDRDVKLLINDRLYYVSVETCEVLETMLRVARLRVSKNR